MLYRIHRIKEAAHEHFRWAAHAGGCAVVKPKDYELAPEVEGPSPYAVWKNLSATGTPLRAGDLLEEISSDQVPGTLYIAKYIGFERAEWFVPEPKPENQPISSAEACI